MTVMTLAERLHAGKKRLQRLGWVQGDAAVFAVENTSCCAATALGPLGYDDYGEISTACRFFERTLGLAEGSIAAWNDEPGRTLEEVLAAYDKAIAVAEAQPCT